MVHSGHNNQDSVIEKALKKFVDAYLRGQQPDTEEFVRQYPDCEYLLRQRIQNLLKINTLFDTLVQMDESDFGSKENGHALVGQTVGSFEIVKIIGRGGMGVVYLAHDSKLDRSVAIKSIPAELQASSTAQARFKREAKLLASLNHPNIATIHDIIEVDKSGYLILEYVPGETLAERIAREPVALEEALSIGQQIAEAVSSAHKKGIVHRDLKPCNIKIRPDGQIKVLDFGLAKPFMGKGKRSDITETQPGRVVGTPAYMSPEQSRGESTDHRTDIWSFGCLMFQMLTGQLPFEGQTATDTLARIIEREPDWKLLPENTPVSIRTLLRRCLEKDPDKRLDNIAEATVQISDTLSKPVTASAVSARLRRAMWTASALIIIVLLAVALRLLPEKQAQLASREIRLVVLPFDNLGPTEEEWFADGMTDEITTRLAGIHGLAVISRQSAIEFKKMGMSTKIAKEFNLDYFLEGTVQCERPSDPNSQVRIRIQLIDTTDDTHIWQETYDKDMSNIFRLQSNIAEQVARALDMTLLEPERQALVSNSTENTEAYLHYVRGNEYFNRLSEGDLKRAIHMFEQAIALDPNSATFHAGLANVLVYRYFRYGENQEYLVRAKEEVDTALNLDPDLFLARIVLGRYYYQGLFDYDRAYEQFDWSCKHYPNYAAGWRWMGLAQRRQGRFKEALPNLKRAAELNPLDLRLLRDVSVALKFLGRYAEAETYLDQVIRFELDTPGGYTEKAWMLILQGNTKKARLVLEEALLNVSKNKESPIYDFLAKLDIYDRSYAAALDKLSLKSQEVDMLAMFIPNALRKAEIYGYMDKEKLEKQCYESAVDILQRKVTENPNVSRYRSALGMAYAGLDRKQDAIDEGLLGVKYETKDAVDKPQRLEDLARIYVMVSQHSEAIKILEHLLKMPSELSVHLLHLDPIWDPLLKEPRFQKLLDSGK